MNKYVLLLIGILLNACASAGPKVKSEVLVTFSEIEQTAEVVVIDKLSTSIKSMKMLAEIGAQSAAENLCGIGKKKWVWPNGYETEISETNPNAKTLTLRIECIQ